MPIFRSAICMLLRMVFSTGCAGWSLGKPGSMPCAHSAHGMLNHNLLHLVGLTHHFILRIHGHTNIKQARKLISWPSSTANSMLLSFDRTQSRVVVCLLTGHYTLRRHFYILRPIDNLLRRRCVAEKETSAHFLDDLFTLRHTYVGCFSWTQRILEV